MADFQSWLTPAGVSRRTIEAHLPLGHAWHAFRITTKVAGKLLTSIARSFEDAWTTLNGLSRELDYRTTEQMVGEWETALSLPDPCLPTANTLAERREWIAFRLTKKRWNTAQDWHDLAALFGLTIRITPGWLVQKPALFKAEFPVPIHVFPKLGRFRVYIDVLGQDYGGFPYDGTDIPEHQFPIPFGEPPGDYEGFRCIIERVAPANVLILWNEFPREARYGTRVTFDDVYSDEYA